MTTSFKPDGFVVRQPGGTKVFDTAERTTNLVPAAELTGSVSLSFPSFTTMAAKYLYSRGSRDGTGTAPFAESCATYGRIAAQEWGPDRANVLPRQLLGSVPAGVDHIAVEALFTQTAAPGTVLGASIVKASPEGRWMTLFDGFATLEDFGTIKRGVAIELIGNQVFASRYQSAAEQDVVLIDSRTNLDVFYRPPDPPFPETVFWQYGPSNQNPCITAFSINLASTWSMTFKVTPGRAGL